MDSLHNSLSPLSHTTPTTHTTNPTSHVNPLADGDDDDADAAGDGVLRLTAGETSGEHGGGSVPAGDLNIKEFLVLATKVIDDGDDEAWALLNELKQRWVARFGPLGTASPRADTGLRLMAPTRLRQSFGESHVFLRWRSTNCRLMVVLRQPPDRRCSTGQWRHSTCAVNLAGHGADDRAIKTEHLYW
ncbi:UNVERIFIED_CONTAM: hypothetical protein Slati_0988600 [Sesamum latifolium]|uniref:Uncharacterized protein n=1 Tax=Sesamum latifolium TaxID=2727402 RepID=A0AAW2XTP2_9LAMI